MAAKKEENHSISLVKAMNYSVNTESNIMENILTKILSANMRLSVEKERLKNKSCMLHSKIVDQKTFELKETIRRDKVEVASGGKKNWTSKSSGSFDKDKIT